MFTVFELDLDITLRHLWLILHLTNRLWVWPTVKTTKVWLADWPTDEPSLKILPISLYDEIVIKNLTYISRVLFRLWATMLSVSYRGCMCRVVKGATMWAYCPPCCASLCNCHLTRRTCYTCPIFWHSLCRHLTPETLFFRVFSPLFEKVLPPCTTPWCFLPGK